MIIYKIYNNIGNRITSENNGTTTNYSANNLNQYETVGDFVPLFDADGNQTKIKTSTDIFEVKYNGENRPIKFTNLSDSTFITMKYDYMGRRGGKLHFNSQGTWTSTVKFFYKDYTLIEESTASNEVLKEFVWDPTEEVATRPLVFKISNEPLYYLHDANKNVVWITNDSCMSIAYYEYDTFGNLTTPIPNIDNPFQFSSEYFDSELSLIYYNYRHYNPISGRWISRDQIEELGSINIYAFLDNNMIDYIDLLGLTQVEIKISTIKTPNQKGMNDEFISVTVNVLVPPPKGWRINFIQLKNQIDETGPDSKNTRRKKTGNWELDTGGANEPPFYYSINDLEKDDISPNSTTLNFFDAPGGSGMSDGKTNIFYLMVVEECQDKNGQINVNTLATRFWSRSSDGKYSYSDNYGFVDPKNWTTSDEWKKGQMTEKNFKQLIDKLINNTTFRRVKELFEPSKEIKVKIKL